MDAQAKHAFHKPLVEKGLGFMVAGLRDHGLQGEDGGSLVEDELAEGRRARVGE